ncbi:MAG: hypothetical protein ABR947_03805 [Solirubrobacteraceae bacterium]
MTEPLSGLVARLGLSDEEALAIFELDALGAIAGDVGHRPEVEILDVLTAEAGELLGEPALARWARARRAAGSSPIDLLLAGDFAAFEDALGRRLGEAA